MNKVRQKWRVDCDQETQTILENMAKQIAEDNKFIKVKMNRLVKHIIQAYSQNGLEKDLPVLREEFLNRREMIISKLRKYQTEEERHEAFEEIAALAKSAAGKKTIKRSSEKRQNSLSSSDKDSVVG